MKKNNELFYITVVAKKLINNKTFEFKTLTSKNITAKQNWENAKENLPDFEIIEILY